jgi:hypothetical protein
MMAVRIILEDQHLQPSQRLLVGVGVLAALSTTILWMLAGRWAMWLLPLWGAPMGWAMSYISSSWVRISAQRGISWCLATKGLSRAKQLGSVALHPSEIAELRLESTLLGRLLGLWDLQIVRRDGQPVPPFKFFHRMDQVGEMLHAYLEQAR